MSDFTTFLSDIRTWGLRPDLDDPTVTTFVRMAETTLDTQMMVREAMQIVNATIGSNGRVSLPPDFNRVDYVRPVNGTPYHFVVKDDFFQMDNTWQHYTLIGDQILIGGTLSDVDTLTIEMNYYRRIPKFTDDSTWLHQYYYNIFLQACLSALFQFSQEFERATAVANVVAGWVADANMNSINSQITTSVLTKRVPKRLGNAINSFR
jgi:hypothetical protein